ncbi:MAG: hypothetical protein WCY89_03480 [Flavobacteriaceae bacterium]
MNPDKLERQFREQLQNRTIEPSDKAWDRLDAMLSVAEKKKKSNGKWWFVAAGFLILFSVGKFFFKAEKLSSTIPNEVVISNPVVETESENESIVTHENTIEITQVNKEVKVVKTKKATIQDNFSSKEKTNSTPDISEIAIQEEKAVAPKENLIEEIVTNKKYISAQSLLAQVESEKKIIEQKSEPKKFESKVQIDASTLLTEAETEMDESFKNRALNEFLNQYQTIKTAVSNRNKE